MMVEQRTRRPMGTSLSDFSKREDFVQADPTFQELEKTAHAANKLTSDLNHKRVSALWKIRRLLIIRDIAMQHSNELEDVGIDDSETLKRYTGDDADSWASSVFTGTEELSDVIYDLCTDVSGAHYEHKQADRSRKLAWEAVSDRRAELCKAWSAQREESTNV
jgi:hypothetical protein